MPELPEVEVTRRQVAPLLLERTIAEVITTAPSYFFLTRPQLLARALTGRRVTALDRHGKYLLAQLDDGARLLLHLGMTGQLFAAGVASPRLLRARKRAVAEPPPASDYGAALVPEQQTSGFTPDAHTHLRLRFADAGPQLFFRDTRKFGKVQLLRAGEASVRLDKLGVDALAATGAALHAKARKRGAPIKTVLLDQAVLAGVGNIYADEALFLSAIRPTRPARKLSAADCGRVVAAAQRVMLRSIETGGSSISDYIQPDGRDGGYQDERRVYARAGQPCLTCGAKIRRIVLGQRSSFFCPRCQK
jgi:formamidopyrimidine-DNA glycosylase